LFLLDGTLLFFRALYGMPDVFHDDAGRSVNGVRGYLTYVLNLIEQRKVEHCVAAFDESLTTCWRNDYFPEYKANRAPADDNIRYQLDCCRKITELLAIPLLADARFEADDFIATLCAQWPGQVTIVSRDKDLQQLLSDSISVLDPAGGAHTTPKEFRDKFGFEPQYFPDYQALTGDSVDNIPGVRGVGPKAAGRLINAFYTLEEVYAHEDEWHGVGIKPSSKMAARLIDEQDRAFLFRRILRMSAEAPVGDALVDARLQAPTGEAVFTGLANLQIRAGLGAALNRSLESYCV
jgi:5'-3' exonuclease